jgi:hypothetical protein
MFRGDLGPCLEGLETPTGSPKAKRKDVPKLPLKGWLALAQMSRGRAPHPLRQGGESQLGKEAFHQESNLVEAKHLPGLHQRSHPNDADARQEFGWLHDKRFDFYILQRLGFGPFSAFCDGCLLIFPAHRSRDFYTTFSSPKSQGSGSRLQVTTRSWEESAESS